MLSRNERIKYNGLFKQAYQKGKSVFSSQLKLTYTETRKQNAEELPLTGFVVGKKFSKKAVKRNKVKRRIREAYRLFRLDSQNTEALKKIGLLIVGLKTQNLNKSIQKKS